MKQSKGMTLIELMVVLVILGIITVFATPAYNRHIIKERAVADAYQIFNFMQSAQERAVSSGRIIIIIPDTTLTGAKISELGNKGDLFKSNVTIGMGSAGADASNREALYNYWGANPWIMGYVDLNVYYSLTDTKSTDRSIEDTASVDFIDNVKKTFKDKPNMIIAKMDKMISHIVDADAAKDIDAHNIPVIAFSPYSHKNSLVEDFAGGSKFYPRGVPYMLFFPDGSMFVPRIYFRGPANFDTKKKNTGKMVAIVGYCVPMLGSSLRSNRGQIYSSYMLGIAIDNVVKDINTIDNIDINMLDKGHVCDVY